MTPQDRNLIVGILDRLDKPRRRRKLSNGEVFDHLCSLVQEGNQQSVQTPSLFMIYNARKVQRRLHACLHEPVATRAVGCIRRPGGGGKNIATSVGPGAL